MRKNNVFKKLIRKLLCNHTWVFDFTVYRGDGAELYDVYRCNKCPKIKKEMY